MLKNKTYLYAILSGTMLLLPNAVMAQSDTPSQVYSDLTKLSGLSPDEQPQKAIELLQGQNLEYLLTFAEALKTANPSLFDSLKRDPVTIVGVTGLPPKPAPLAAPQTIKLNTPIPIDEPEDDDKTHDHTY